MEKQLNTTMQILRLNEVKQKTGLSRASIYAYIAANKFPKSIQLGVRAVGWLEAEINSWIAERAELRGGK